MAELIFPLVFVGMWLAVTTLLGLMSGWYALARHFPDRPEEPGTLELRNQSGTLGLGVGLSRILHLSACPSGLRVAINRLFGPFSRPFLVPWKDLAVERGTLFWSPRAVLRFAGGLGRLSIEGHVADLLWRAAPNLWPESGPPPAPEPPRTSARTVLIQWAVGSALASAFFTIVPLLAMPRGRPPLAVAIGFPCVAFGIFALVQYAARRRLIHRGPGAPTAPGSTGPR
jgi:hypothetical protein